MPINAIGKHAQRTKSYPAAGGARERKKRVSGASQDWNAIHSASTLVQAGAGGMKMETATVSASAVPSTSEQECGLRPSCRSVSPSMAPCVAPSMACIAAGCPSIQPACAMRCCIPSHCENSSIASSSAAKPMRTTSRRLGPERRAHACAARAIKGRAGGFKKSSAGLLCSSKGSADTASLAVTAKAPPWICRSHYGR